jgi:hypothetical protein
VPIGSLDAVAGRFEREEPCARDLADYRLAMVDGDAHR